MADPTSHDAVEAPPLSIEERRSVARILRVVREEAERSEQTPRLKVALRQLSVALRYVVTGR